VRKQGGPWPGGGDDSDSGPEGFEEYGARPSRGTGGQPWQHRSSGRPPPDAAPPMRRDDVKRGSAASGAFAVAQLQGHLGRLQKPDSGPVPPPPGIPSPQGTPSAAAAAVQQQQQQQHRLAGQRPSGAPGARPSLSPSPSPAGAPPLPPARLSASPAVSGGPAYATPAPRGSDTAAEPDYGPFGGDDSGDEYGAPRGSSGRRGAGASGGAGAMPGPRGPRPSPPAPLAARLGASPAGSLGSLGAATPAALRAGGSLRAASPALSGGALGTGSTDGTKRRVRARRGGAGARGRGGGGGGGGEGPRHAVDMLGVLC
jgi:translation initiation factor IF-2